MYIIYLKTFEIIIAFFKIEIENQNIAFSNQFFIS